MIRKLGPAVVPAAVDDLLLPEGKSQKFVEDLERETERSVREMDRTFHVRQAMDELAIVKDAVPKPRARAPLSDRRDARTFPAPAGGNDTLIDAPKVVVRGPFERDAPTVLTDRRREALAAPRPRVARGRAWPALLGGALLLLVGLAIYASVQPERTGVLARTPMTVWLVTGRSGSATPATSDVPTAAQEPAPPSSAPVAPSAAPSVRSGAARPNIND